MAAQRKPTALLRMTGTWRADRHGNRNNEPRATGDLGLPPDHLDEPTKAIWTEIASAIPAGVGARADRHALEALSILFRRIRDGNATASEFSQVRALMAAFGLMPSARASLSSTAQEPARADDFDF